MISEDIANTHIVDCNAVVWGKSYNVSFNGNLINKHQYLLMMTRNHIFIQS